MVLSLNWPCWAMFYKETFTLENKMGQNCYSFTKCLCIFSIFSRVWNGIEGKTEGSKLHSKPENKMLNSGMPFNYLVTVNLGWGPFYFFAIKINLKNLWRSMPINSTPILMVALSSLFHNPKKKGKLN